MKNTLENLLSNNLLRRREELQQDLEDLVVTNSRQQLEMRTTEFEHVCKNIEHVRKRQEGIGIFF